MFLRTTTAAAAVMIGIAASPASAAIVDIYADASITEVLRSGFFERGFDPSAYSFYHPKVADGAFEMFGDAKVGDTVLIHWELDTEDRNGWDLDPEDKSEETLYGYPGGPITATFTINGTSWKVGNGEGSNANYIDKPDRFSLSYSSSDNADYYLGGYPSHSTHETSINVRPEEYVTSKGLMNEFQSTGNNLGSGNFQAATSISTYVYSDEYPYEIEEDVYSSLGINYQLTSIKASLRGSGVGNIKIASTPLPAGALLIVTGLFGFGLLRRRKA